jgi:hypothetical protein
MSLVFEPITLDKQEEYSEYFSMCSQKTSDYSFVNLWGWAEEYGLTWAWLDKTGGSGRTILGACWLMAGC